MTNNSEKAPGIRTLALAGGLIATLVLGYLFWWIVVVSPVEGPFAHAWLALFSAQPEGSIDQLI